MLWKIAKIRKTGGFLPIFGLAHISISARKIFCVALHNAVTEPSAGGLICDWTYAVKDPAGFTDLSRPSVDCEIDAGRLAQRGFDGVPPNFVCIGLPLEIARQLHRGHHAAGGSR
ncbi:hypothetical protein CK228_22920 [Mesorhizobium sp. WSM4312]|uniref:hypothetical protein n=1 Tax=unclassified Mesorhizobium TaxID=325217 RepID=UPI000BB0A789|nr:MULTISPECIES: hypothetical protein [unclassified Mesorhizobium]PBB66402.1 hypothetical protein CK228_22920 [Mesorhizobium sp. WSM4312]PBC19704.1 hypothetical protein CK226_27930 [Mesorhizobium sp. WSM4311]TRC77480.1 hypothetical protein FJV81_13175 [Mesorhizobium sp. WSM4315]TRC80121.1 hypothetical protein FJV83_28110 [Mesorhizobium sp. WSM4307]TRC85869.1 hypothetical protein FJV80_16315 [Mesorhizobium sp. WSM4310]